MRARLFGIVLCALTVGWLDARPQARLGDDRSALDAASVREFLEGSTGRRDAWKTAPGLVIVTSVMDYATGDLPSGFPATSDNLTDDEVAQLTVDLNRAFQELTGGVFERFSSINIETARAGQLLKVIRPGQIVVGRFRGVQTQTGNLGYGGRSTRKGAINGAAVILDADFDRTSDRRHLLRTHELGHALGYHHVESRPSVMNPRVGSDLTDFDRAVVRLAAMKVSAQF